MPGPVGFLHLPSELRNQIYDQTLCCDDEGPTYIETESSELKAEVYSCSKKGINLNLIKASKAILEETIGILYWEIDLTHVSELQAAYFFKIIGKKNARRIRVLRMKFPDLVMSGADPTEEDNELSICPADHVLWLLRQCKCLTTLKLDGTFFFWTKRYTNKFFLDGVVEAFETIDYFMKKTWVEDIVVELPERIITQGQLPGGTFRRLYTEMSKLGWKLVEGTGPWQDSWTGDESVKHFESPLGTLESERITFRDDRFLRW